MPRLTDYRQTKTISLPGWPDSKVEIYSSLLVGDALEINLKEENQVLLSVALLPHYIKSWNFTDEKDKPLEITKENLGFLQMEDLQYLVDELTKFMNEGKKKDDTTPASVTA